MKILEKIEEKLKGLFRKEKQYSTGNTTIQNLFGRYILGENDTNLINLSSETWAYTCATYAANAVSTVSYKLVAQNKGNIRVPTKQLSDDTVEVISHPILSLLENPNPRQTKFEFLSETQIYIDTTGDCFWFLIYNILGVPSEIEILPTQNVKIEINKEGQIIGYIYKPQNETSEYRIDPENIIHFRTANVRSRYTGMGCLEAAYKSSILLNSMNDLEISLNKNMAIPAVVVKYTDGTLDRENIKRLEAEWNSALRGISKTGKVKVADENFEINTIGLSPREMNFLSGRKWSREEICAAYRVPISLVTSESVNRANAEAGLYQFALYGVLPRVILLEETLNKFLIPKYNEPRINLKFNNPVPQDREFELRKLQALSSIYTPEELRERLEKL